MRLAILTMLTLLTGCAPVDLAGFWEGETDCYESTGVVQNTLTTELAMVVEAQEEPSTYLFTSRLQAFGEISSLGDDLFEMWGVEPDDDNIHVNIGWSGELIADRRALEFSETALSGGEDLTVDIYEGRLRQDEITIDFMLDARDIDRMDCSITLESGEPLDPLNPL